MARLSVSDAWTASAELLRRDGRLLLPVALLLIGLPNAALELFIPGEVLLGLFKGGPFSPILLLLVPLSFATLIGSLALIAMALIRQVSVGEALGAAVRRFPTALVAGMIVSFAAGAAALAVVVILVVSRPLGATLTLAGFVALIYVYVRLMLLGPVVIAERVDPVAALRRSWRLSRGGFWRLLGFLLVFGVGSIVLGIVSRLIGGLFGTLFDRGFGLTALATFLEALFPALAGAIVSMLYATIIAAFYRQLTPADG